VAQSCYLKGKLYVYTLKTICYSAFDLELSVFVPAEIGLDILKNNQVFQVFSGPIIFLINCLFQFYFKIYLIEVIFKKYS